MSNNRHTPHEAAAPQGDNDNTSNAISIDYKARYVDSLRQITQLYDMNCRIGLANMHQDMEIDRLRRELTDAAPHAITDSANWQTKFYQLQSERTTQADSTEATMTPTDRSLP